MFISPSDMVAFSQRSSTIFASSTGSSAAKIAPIVKPVGVPVAVVASSRPDYVS